MLFMGHRNRNRAPECRLPIFTGREKLDIAGISRRIEHPRLAVVVKGGKKVRGGGGGKAAFTEYGARDGEELSFESAAARTTVHSLQCPYPRIKYFKVTESHTA